MQWNNRIVYGHVRTIKISKTITQRLFHDDILKQTDLGEIYVQLQKQEILKVCKYDSITSTARKSIALIHGGKY